MTHPFRATRRGFGTLLAVTITTSLGLGALAHATPARPLRTLQGCDETFATLDNGLSIVTSACDGITLSFAGTTRDDQPGPWNENDRTDPFHLLTENEHLDLLWVLTDDAVMADELRRAGVAPVHVAELTFESCLEDCSAQRLRASWEASAGRSEFTLSLSQPAGGVITPDHRHDYVWWGKPNAAGTDAWMIWVEHGSAVERGGPVELTATGPAAAAVGAPSRSGLGFIQRDMTTPLHIGPMAESTPAPGPREAIELPETF